MLKFMKDRDFIPTVLIIAGMILFCCGWFLVSTVAGLLVTGVLLVVNGISLMAPAEADTDRKRLKEADGDE